MLADRQKVLSANDKILEWALYLFIFCLPLSKSIVEIAITVAFVCFVIKKALLKERPFSASQLNIAYLVFILCLLPSFFNTYSVLFSLRALISKNIKFVLLALITAEVIDNKVKMKNLLTMALLSGMTTTINAFAQYYLVHADLFRGYQSFKYIHTWAFIEPRLFVTNYFIGFPTASFPFPNDFAAWLLVFTLPVLTMVFMFNTTWRNKLLCALCFVPMFYFLILTKARAAWLGFFIGAAFLFFFRLKKIVIFSLVLMLTLYLYSNRLIAGYVVQVRSVEDRVEMWDNGWKIFKQHPVIGNGINTFFEYYKRVRQDRWKGQRGSYAHNCFLQMAADTGVVGLGGFLCLLFVFFRNTIKETLKIKTEFYKLLNLGVLAGILAFLVHSFFDTNLYSLPLAALFWFAIGLTQAVLKTGEAEVV